MADSPLSSLPSAGALDGSELVYIVKAGVSSQSTAQTVADLSPATPPGGSTGQLQYNDGSGFAGANVWREDANTLALRNGTTAQVSYVYNTYTDSSNYERGVFGWSANVLNIGTQEAGTGTLRNVNISGGTVTINGARVDDDSSVHGLSYWMGSDLAKMEFETRPGYVIDPANTAGEYQFRVNQGGFWYLGFYMGSVSGCASDFTLAFGSYLYIDGGLIRFNNAATPDTTLLREASNTVAFRNGTSAQKVLFYNTRTNSSNYERAIVGWSSNVLEIGAEAAGTGTLRSVLIKGDGVKVADTGQKLGFYGTAPIAKPAEITDELTTITFTAPGTPDYAIQDLTNSSGYGFATKDEGNTVLAVIANLQARVNELESVLVSLGLLTDAD